MSLGRAGSRRTGIYSFLFFNTYLVQSSFSFIKVTKNSNDIIEKSGLRFWFYLMSHHGGHEVEKLTRPEHNWTKKKNVFQILLNIIPIDATRSHFWLSLTSRASPMYKPLFLYSVNNVSRDKLFDTSLPIQCLMIDCKLRTNKRHLAYGWRDRNIKWPIRIKKAGKTLLSRRQCMLTGKALQTGNFCHLRRHWIFTNRHL